MRSSRVSALESRKDMRYLDSHAHIFSEEFAEDEKRYPLGYGEPEDVANTIAFLLSDASKWMTGSELILDGGLTLH